MSRAEEAAMKVYPNILFPFTPLDLNAYRRGAFINGYETAEKDLADVAAFSSGPDGFYYGRGYQQGKKDSEKDLALTIQDLELLHTFLYAVKNNKHGAFTFTRLTDEQYAEVLKRYLEAKR